jgi:UDP-glucose 4-epimerase
MHILITGGAGFIGSHTCVELLNAGHDIVVVDNLTNSNIESLNRVEKMTNKKIIFHKIDMLNYNDLYNIFINNDFYCVIHFAGLKSVNESINDPILYYDNNLRSTINLLKVMQQVNCKRLIFSSSATVYGELKSPLIETMEIGKNISNPYGQTKFMIEKMLDDLDISWKIISLRYFNPVGAHESGLIGEDPNGIPNNLMPYILKVAVNNNTNKNLGIKYDRLTIYGNDYSTKDGTCLRDFIHVVDLAKGHLKAVQHIDNVTGNDKINLGTGEGISVLEIVETFKKENKLSLPYIIDKKREGDQEQVFCDPSKAFKLLGWKTEKSIKDICIDAWRWQKDNPNGFDNI